MTVPQAISRFVMRHRIAAMVVVLGVTAFFATQIRKVRVESLLIDLFPEDHEFV